MVDHYALQIALDLLGQRSAEVRAALPPGQRLALYAVVQSELRGALREVDRVLGEGDGDD